MFLEKRVYQGSSGKVYPLPFIDRIAEDKVDVAWDAVHLENEFLYVMLLPQLGGRIHVARDKTNGYDFIYRQNVIKPALVGLAGPWVSGGVEFNWPQHHRPATFMPVNVDIERHDDGSITVWCSDYDPMSRMKGMHGICLHPGRAEIEIKVRAYNRTAMPQTFLWWANIATRVNAHYQSFFPPDVTYVADHAKRSMSTYPLCTGHYYGVDYARRARDGVPLSDRPTQYAPLTDAHGQRSYAANDLSYYANIPVPTSYMCMGSRQDFFGGYDHQADAGIVHFADHHIAPGKKQWTWGNHDFGYAWDRCLTDATADGEFPPYIELMAGVYTDNQPDFSYLMPGETKTWSQYLYPIQKIGTAQHASREAALHLHLDGRVAHVGVSVTRAFAAATVVLRCRKKTVRSDTCALAPGASWTAEVNVPKNTAVTDLTLSVLSADGRTILEYTPHPRPTTAVPPAATEPPEPAAVASNDALLITATHLQQYRHATRDPMAYWQEALARDPGDSRVNDAVGLWHLRRGEFDAAERHFRTAIERLTALNPNPYDGESHYHLGVVLRHMGRDAEAYDAFHKAVWNQAWRAAGYHALAELACRQKDWAAALDHVDRALTVNADHLAAQNLRTMILTELGDTAAAAEQLAATRRSDRLDPWSCHLAGDASAFDTKTKVDTAADLARAGFEQKAIAVLESAAVSPDAGVGPLVQYHLAKLYAGVGRSKDAKAACRAARRMSPDYCFPFGLDDMAALRHALATDPADARAAYYLGNLYYDCRRRDEAITLWEQAVRHEPAFSIPWRNLGIAYYNVRRNPAKARVAYDRAVAAAPADARLLYERDQLWKRLGHSPAKRLAVLERRADLVRQRDDLSVEVCSLYNAVGRHDDARQLMGARNFQPWEGGEGLAAGEHVRTHLAIGRRLLRESKADDACEYFRAALTPPRNLGEGKHLLVNQSNIHYWLGVALAAASRTGEAKRHWTQAAKARGDFQDMSVRAFSEMTYYSARALQQLHRPTAAEKLLTELLAYAGKLAATPARIDYFATSLPTMLLFDEDLDRRQKNVATFLEAQAQAGLGRQREAVALLDALLAADPAHAAALDFKGELRGDVDSQ